MRPLLASRADLRHVGDELQDFADTAALVELMDVVVTVDTSVANLAGAMGKPVWILLPFNPHDWRWMLDREDSIWYPTARLFRQPAAGDWASVVRRVGGELVAAVRRAPLIARAPAEIARHRTRSTNRKGVMQNRQGALSEIDALEAAAMRAAQTGQEKEAIRLWGRILAIDPNHAADPGGARPAWPFARPTCRRRALRSSASSTSTAPMPSNGSISRSPAAA